MKVELKRVTEDDLERLMEWRARPDITEYLFNDVKVDMEKQRAWFKRLQQDNTQIRWIIWCDGVPVGMNSITDIDYVNKRCEAGLMFIAEKKYRSLNLVIDIRCNMRDYVFYKLGLNRLYAYVITANRQIVKMAEMTGSNIEGIMRQHCFKNGKFYDVAITSLLREQWDEMRLKEHYEKCYME